MSVTTSQWEKRHQAIKVVGFPKPKPEDVLIFNGMLGYFTIANFHAGIGNLYRREHFKFNHEKGVDVLLKRGDLFELIAFAENYGGETKLDLRNSKMREIPLDSSTETEWLECKKCQDTFQQPKGRTSKLCEQCTCEGQMIILASEDQGGHERECSEEREADGTSFGALAQPDSCPCPTDIKPVKLEYDADKLRTDKHHG